MSILVAVARDGAREQVLRAGVRLAQGLDEPLEVVHLVEDEFAEGEAKAVRDELRSFLADAPAEARVSLEHVGHRGPRTGPRIARDLLELAEDVDVTHIVVGHTSKSLVRGIARGSTAFAVADSADVPVTVVPDAVE